jgi:hypothetical protein
MSFMFIWLSYMLWFSRSAVQDIENPLKAQHAAERSSTQTARKL